MSTREGFVTRLVTWLPIAKFVTRMTAFRVLAFPATGFLLKQITIRNFTTMQTLKDVTMQMKHSSPHDAEHF
jgi:hypothetical protein